MCEDLVSILSRRTQSKTSIGADSSHVITWSRFIMVLILHMCKDFVLVIYICEVLVPIPHICEDLVLIYIYIYILLCFAVKNLYRFFYI